VAHLFATSAAKAFAIEAYNVFFLPLSTKKKNEKKEKLKKVERNTILFQWAYQQKKINEQVNKQNKRTKKQQIKEIKQQK
jgi:hypothetical protein